MNRLYNFIVLFFPRINPWAFKFTTNLTALAFGLSADLLRLTALARRARQAVQFVNHITANIVLVFNSITGIKYSEIK
jgi:hypothetical protein